MIGGGGGEFVCEVILMRDHRRQRQPLGRGSYCHRDQRRRPRQSPERGERPGGGSPDYPGRKEGQVPSVENYMTMTNLSCSSKPSRDLVG